MSALRFDIASSQDDAQLREVLAATPMDGQVRISFRREPDFFDASVVEGPFSQTLVARDGDQIAGVGCRSVRPRYVNGERVPIGYLSGLRLMPPYRGSGMLARGYRYLHSLHQDGRTRLYLTTIAEGNEVALRTLTSARSWLPRYHPAGRYCTFVIPTGRAGHNTRSMPAQLDIRKAREQDLPEMLEFLNETGRHYQFFPVYEARDFFDRQGTFRDLHASDILLAFRGRQLVGVLGAWDQRRYRQTVVEGYRGPLRAFRGVYNLWARVRRLPRLPAPRQVFPFITAALPLVKDNDRDVFRALIIQLTAGTIDGPRGNHLLLGLHEDNPLIEAARPFATHKYLTRLFYVCWEDGEPLRQRLEPYRPPYLELGCL